MKRKAQANLIDAVVAVIVGAILLIGVAVPIVDDVVSNASLSGTAETLATYLSVFLVLAVLMLVVSLISRR